MIKKHHPKDRGERLNLKKLHDNASPVAVLLMEKETLDAASKKKRDRVLAERSDTQGPDYISPTQD